MHHDLPPLRDRVREILLTDWDPNDHASSQYSRGAYDVYIDPLIELLRTDADVEAIAQWLLDREKEFMCFSGLGTGRLLPAARKLNALRSLP